MLKALHGEGRAFSFVGHSRTLNRAKATARRLSFSAQQANVPREPATKKNTWKWREQIPRKFKFVDDGTFVTKLNVVSGFTEAEDEEGSYRLKRDVATENVFNRTISRASAQGMKVNLDKTGMLVVHDSMAYRPKAYILDQDGNRITSDSKTLKIVGFHFSERPDASLHVKETISKARRRFWVLRHLQRAGFKEADLVKVYCSVIRSVIEYCNVVYGPLLTCSQSEAVERLQSQNLNIIHGFDKSYRSLLESTGLETLEERRAKAELKFAEKCLEGRYAHWFPLNGATRKTRNQNVYMEEYARCDRLRKTPVYHMRRMLNIARR